MWFKYPEIFIIIFYVIYRFVQMVKIIHNTNRHDFHGYVSEYITIGVVANRQKMRILAYIPTH